MANVVILGWTLIQGPLVSENLKHSLALVFKHLVLDVELRIDQLLFTGLLLTEAVVL